MKSLPFFIFCSSLLAFAYWRYHIFHEKIILAEPKKVIIKTVLRNEPSFKQASQVFYVKKCKIVSSLYPQFHYGDFLLVKGIAKPPDCQIIFPSIQVLEKNQGNVFLDLIFRFKRNLVEMINSSFPRLYAVLLSGMLFGTKDNLPFSFYQNLKKTGLLHIIVVSGFNFTIVARFLNQRLKFLGKKRSFFVTLFVLFIYALFCGFEAPVLRAFLMTFLTLIAELFGRQKDAIRVLLASGVFILLLNPKSFEDISFYLSFFGTAGILILTPLLKDFVKIDFLGIREELATTLGAQLGVTPLLVYFFGEFSLISLITNPTMLWLIEPIMFFGFVSILIMYVSKYLLIVISIPFLVLMTLFVFLTNFWGNFAFSQIKLPKSNVSFLISFYLILVLIYFILLRMKNKYGKK